MTTEKRPVKKSPTTKNESTETTTTTTTDNKSVFGPLGKYAVVAVIMVSIIVTTAIMLDKQLNSVEEQIAVIEDEVAEMNTASADTAATETEIVDTSITAEVDEADIAETVINEALVAETQTSVETAETEATASKVLSTTETPTAETTTADTAETQTPVTTARQSQQLAIANQTRENQARIEVYKREQKARMTEMFARIRSLEAQQLDQYKVNQDKRVERLRGQVAQQQELIEALILRNKKSLKMREANVQKNQTSREQVLNRI